MLGIKVKNEAFMTAVDTFSEYCRYVDFKRELISERKSHTQKKVCFWEEMLSLTFKCRQCYLPFPEQKSRIRWPQYMEDEPNRTEIATGAVS